MAAVRVPPSALSTSASTWIVQGPRARRVDDGPEAPADQPLDLGGPAVGPAPTSASGVLPGSIAYSAVSQPTPLPSRNGGTLSDELGRDEHGRRPGAVEHAARAVGGRIRARS